MYSLNMQLLLVGNYGVGNLGDEALKEYFIRLFSADDLKILSSNPIKDNEYYRLPSGIRSFFSFNWINTIRIFWRSDAVVFGGGSLFTDTESSFACVIWGIHVFCAWIFRKPVILAFQGIGPLKTVRSRLITRAVLRTAVYISVRDELSYLFVQSLVKNKKIIQSFDPVFALIERREYDLRSQKVFIAIPRNNSNATFQNIFINLLKSNRWNEVHILSLMPDDKSEIAFCDSLNQSTKLPVKLLPVRNLDDLSSEVANGSFVLSQRYHGAIAALALGRELMIIPQGDNDKLASIQQIIDEIPLNSRIEILMQRVLEGETTLKKLIDSYSL